MKSDYIDFYYLNLYLPPLQVLNLSSPFYHFSQYSYSIATDDIFIADISHSKLIANVNI